MFDITSPEFSYIIGLLQSDGHHSESSRGRGRIRIELNEQDADVLESIRAHIPYYTSICKRSRVTNFGSSDSVILSLYDQEARRILENYGVVTGNKSGVVAPPIPDYSKSDYVRGVLDADGSVGFTGKGMPFVSVVLTSDAMAEYFSDLAQSVCGVTRNLKRNTRDNVYTFMVTNSAAAKLANWAYPTDNCLSIVRKRVAARKVADWLPPEGLEHRYGRVRKIWTAEDDEVVLRLPRKAAAERLGRTLSSVQNRAHRLQSATRPSC